MSIQSAITNGKATLSEIQSAIPCTCVSRDGLSGMGTAGNQTTNALPQASHSAQANKWVSDTSKPMAFAETETHKEYISMIEVIAEIGVNHNGDFFTACKLVDAAIEAGATAVKTQLWNTERVYPRERWDEMKRLELSRNDIQTLQAFCRGRGIELIVTPDELDDATFLRDIGVKRIKTSSQDVTNLRFLTGVGMLGLPVIFSTGACNWAEMNIGLKALHGGSHDSDLHITLLHCVSAYPAPVFEMNLGV